MKKIDLFPFDLSKDKDVRRKYPELNSIEEFRRLGRQQMTFVWHYANPTSKSNESEDINIKIRRCLFYAWGRELRADIESKYLSKIFPEDVKAAIEKMSNFEPTVRARSRIMLEKMLDKLEDMIDVDETEFNNKEGDIDWTKKRAYIESMKSVTSMLPEIISKLEDGFGVTISEETGLSEKPIDRFHEHNE